MKQSKCTIIQNQQRIKMRIIKLFFMVSVMLISILIAIKIPMKSKGANGDLLQKLGNSSYMVENYEMNDDEMQVNESKHASSWNLLLVNRWNYITENFSIELTRLINGQSIDTRVYPELQEMMDDMRVEGLSPLICSSYRTNAQQSALYEEQVHTYLAKGYSQIKAEEIAARWVAVPGTSEHQAGLALDIVDTNYQELDEEQENTAVQKWLIDNSWKYGFILRYPNGKSNITGINYEPWHYRYVGKEAAKEIYEKGICLEEYLEEQSDY